MSWQSYTQIPHLNNTEDELKQYCAINSQLPPRLYNVTLIMQYILKFWKIKEYIEQSFIVAPTYAILLHKPIYCAIILSI